MSADRRMVALGVDDTEASRQALKFFLKNIAKTEDFVVFLHVREPGRDDTALLEYYKTETDNMNIQNQSMSEAAGDVRNVLYTAVEREHPNLLVVGTRGLGPFGRFFLGSVSDFLSKNTTCPILIVKGNQEGKEGKRRVCISVDPSELSKEAFHWTIQNVVKDGDFVQALHVSSPGSIGLPIIGYKKETHDAAVIDLMRYYQKWAADNLKNCEFQAKVMSVNSGDPRDEMITSITEEKIDLLVMGSRGLGTVKRLALGSMSSYAVENSPCSILIYKPKTAPKTA
eukprot:TRINITY_DN1276_c0_g1::TRINITY_DN1276_c0_g1_i1::g.26887::m.26887 TRINITY_DN1276_c0_g1::TRINITY_DN1276_c0_g1_i1::g.26887  ORF type:complete len:284 (-),score=96.22,sp/Q8LGG8/USPAL_ARATH/28.87/5e-11,sp/Q8LGG8/USPAL_ARATH/25.34/7e-09,Usp/PF00582.21/9.4e-17,Usp/PF00582.21/1.4e-18,DUF4470/PF14737.1/1.5,DUF4470/PF14737.1/61,K_oxygenase/PF13434.1/0.073 TRINITY_DN1276_c0_g1_i1:153-1004(-)